MERSCSMDLIKTGIKRVGMILAGSIIAASPACSNAAELTIMASGSGMPISPDLVGVFFEDLNYAADGGLYPELIQNRSFEYNAAQQPSWGPLSFWELRKTDGGDGVMKIGDYRSIHKNNPNYMLLVVSRAGNGVGITNSGFDGISLKAGESYEASFWAYQAFMNEQWGGNSSIDGKPMPVTIRLEAKDGKVLAEAKLDVAGRAWTKYSVVLKPTESVVDAKFVLLAQAKGGLALDMVSLYPQDTFKGRKNGLRKDLAQAIADIKPGFIRFPGGCLVHGSGIHQYYDWKESVGPLEQRKEDRNLWGYGQTRGLGYYEFFQYCEDVGALPLPVVAAGVCCQHGGDSPGIGQEGLPMDEMPAYIQDVIDLIEWANGPADSKWGAVRVAAGHPEPFGLKYLGIGNEDAITPVFKERFKMIYDAVKKAHPEITIVGTSGPFHSGSDYDNGWALAKELKLEMVDEHYYVNPQWFWDNLNRYDKYSRSGSKVYVGEYAAHDSGKRNTLRSALAEAAHLTSMERNGDIVSFASYAPLLARRNHTQWTPDMIYFDAQNMYPSANYSVQKLFGQNSGDSYLDTTLTVDQSEAKKLAASAVLDSVSGDTIVKIVNGEDKAVELTVMLAGLPNVEMKTVKTVLTGANGDVVNEDGKAPAITVQEENVMLKTEFKYSVPANSLTVYRIDN